MEHNEDNPTVADPVWARDNVNFHDVDQLPNGTPVGRLGAKWYVLDEHGNAVSKGYHEIRVVGERYMGKLGANEEPVEFPLGRP